MSLQPGQDPLAAVRCIDRLPLEILCRKVGFFDTSHSSNGLAELALP